MSTIDLDRLVIRQTYFIPVKGSELMPAIMGELNAGEQTIEGLHRWVLEEVHKRSFRFTHHFKYSYVSDETWGMNPETTEYKEKVKQKIEDFDNKGMEAFFAELKRLFSHVPAKIDVRVLNEETVGCQCKVRCIPMLYEKLRYLRNFETNDFQIQNAYLESKRFLEVVFESGLSATLIVEERKSPPQSATEFLTNDQASRQILMKIEEMLDQATGEVLICGWIGTILLPKLKEITQKGIDVRIITHKSNELRGKPGSQDVQRAHKELVSLLGKDHISVRPECHFRVLVVDNEALVGSMDFNATSLTGTHREFAIYLEIPEIVRSIRNYFNQIFTPLSEQC